jgi:plasmid maintenance system antidote protein VapI
MSSNDVIGPSLRHAAERAALRPAFLGFAIRAYLAARGIDDRALAAELGVDSSTLDRLFLCRRDPAATRQNVRVVAEFLHIDLRRLSNLVNAAEATIALASVASAGDSTLLAAARDRSDDQEDRSEAAGDATSPQK